MQVGGFDVERGEGTLRMTRGRDALRVGTVVLALVAVGVAGASFVGRPELTILGMVILATGWLTLSALWADRLAARGVLQRVRRTVEVKPTAGGYRDGAGSALLVDGESFDTKRVREVTTRRIDNGQDQNRDIHFLYLVLDDRAFVVAQSLNEGAIGEIAGALRDVLEVDAGDDGAREPVRVGNMVLLAILGVVELGAMAPAFLPAMRLERDGPAPALDHLWPPLAIVAVAVVFTALMAPLMRRTQRQRAKALFGIG